MKYLIPFLIIAILSSCKDSSSKNTFTATTNNENLADTFQHSGKKLMESKCYLCHNPNTTQENLIAPPMIAIKMHYLDEDTSKEVFINSILAWTKAPTVEKSKMNGAVKRFGVMPYQPYEDDDIHQIAAYMYDYDIEQPEWFEEHFQNERGNGKGMGFGNGKANGKGNSKSSSSQKSIEEIGLEYALSTKQILGQNLMGTIQKKGTLAALEFCNVQAYPLTDSMATVHHAKIKRVSDKPRNPSNKANSKELEYIKAFKKDIASGTEIKPIVEKNTNGTIDFYYPITTNTMCLQCHGTKNEVSPETLSAIKNLYPNDQAVGYGVNEVRGIWSIQFQEEK